MKHRSRTRTTQGISLLCCLISALPAAAAPMLEEVVVTAQRRAQSTQDVPVAITGLSGDQVDKFGLNNASDVSAQVPNMQVSSPYGDIQPIFSIRGVSMSDYSSNQASPIGVYVDEAYLAPVYSHGANFFDVERLEVLRGPQGTLYGKNTTGGALVLSLEKPNEEFSGYVEGVLGNYKTRAARAGLNIPFTDNFYTRIALNVSKNEGYVEDKGEGSNNNSTDGYSALFQTRWDASDSFHLDTLLFYGESHAKIQNSNCNIGNDDALFVDGLGLMFPGDTDGRVGVAYRENCENNSRANQGDLTTDKGPNA